MVLNMGQNIVVLSDRKDVKAVMKEAYTLVMTGQEAAIKQ
jgi:hypothetical protein